MNLSEIKASLDRVFTPCPKCHWNGAGTLPVARCSTLGKCCWPVDPKHLAFIEELDAAAAKGLGDCPNCDTALVDVVDGKCEFCRWKEKRV